MALRLQQLTGQAIGAYIQSLAKLRIEVFREYPYLYDGDMDYEARYLATYAESPQSLFILVWDGDEIVGASTGLPMADESEAFSAVFQAHGFDISRIFYFGESVILPAYRGQGTGAEFFRIREDYARKLGGFEFCVFCAVDREPDHPAKSSGYQPLNVFWQRMGYSQQAQLKTHISWKELGQSAETPKALTAWVKQLTAN